MDKLCMIINFIYNPNTGNTSKKLSIKKEVNNVKVVAIGALWMYTTKLIKGLAKKGYPIYRFYAESATLDTIASKKLEA